MKSTTRYRIIEYMQEKKGVSAAELARVFKITAADARHHLTSLEYEGVVVVVDTRVHGRGRPTQLYRLSRVVNRHNMGALTSAVLDEWLDSVAEYDRDAVFHRIAAHLAAGCSPPKGNLTQRLTYAIRQLIKLNYLARWEAHIESPRILITHCPYALVVPEHPETCRMDAFVIEKIVGQAVTKIQPIGVKVPGEMQCIFRLDPEALAIDTPTTTK